MLFVKHQDHQFSLFNASRVLAIHAMHYVVTAFSYHLLVAPLVTIANENPLRVSEGESTVLNCMATGWPAPSIQVCSRLLDMLSFVMLVEPLH